MLKIELTAQTAEELAQAARDLAAMFCGCPTQKLKDSAEAHRLDRALETMITEVVAEQKPVVTPVEDAAAIDEALKHAVNETVKALGVERVRAEFAKVNPKAQRRSDLTPEERKALLANLKGLQDGR